MRCRSWERESIEPPVPQLPGVLSEPQDLPLSDGSTCTAAFDSGASVILTATAASGSAFSGWGGEGCSGTGICTVTMGADRTVTATFSRVFTNATLTAQTTVIKASHINELRTAVRALE